MNRRNWMTNFLGGAATVTAALAGAPLLAEHEKKHEHKHEHDKKHHTEHGKKHGEKLKIHDNSFFYKDGKFDHNAGKQAFKELFEHYHYSLADVIDDERFWVEDFGLGDFAHVGMGGIFWFNDKEHGYFGHEIFLLPFQMIPEHAHVAAEDMPPKHEYWQVRNGSIYNFSAGGSKNDPMPPGVTLPKSQLDANAITCFKWKELTARTGIGKGEAALNNLEEYHFMMGGPEGAIVTEYASYHSQDGLKIRAKETK